MIHYTKQLPSNILVSSNETFRWFSGTSYLGMAQLPEFKALVAEGIQQYGTSWGSSRNNNVRLAVYEEAEQLLASEFNTQASLTVSSGMVAGQLIVTLCKQQGYHPIYSPKTHPALWDESTVIPKLSFSDWATQLNQQIEAHPSKRIVIYSDSVASPYVEELSFDWIKHLPKNREILVVIDASHSLGIGIPPAIYQSQTEVIITSSLNKAMGMPGGIMLGSKERIEYIRSMTMFSGASPMMPALLFAYTKGQSLFWQQQKQLKENISYFNQKLPLNHPFDYFDNYPCYCTREADLHEYLKQQGIMTAHFSYPKATDPAVTRLVITALHTAEDLHYLQHCLQAFVALATTKE